MTTAEAKLIALYGTCPTCGSPRKLHRIEETDYETGHIATWTRILCAKEPVAHYAKDDAE